MKSKMKSANNWEFSSFGCINCLNILRSTVFSPSVLVRRFETHGRTSLIEEQKMPSNEQFAGDKSHFQRNEIIANAIDKEHETKNRRSKRPTIYSDFYFNHDPAREKWIMLQKNSFDGHSIKEARKIWLLEIPRVPDIPPRRISNTCYPNSWSHTVPGLMGLFSSKRLWKVEMNQHTSWYFFRLFKIKESISPTHWESFPVLPTSEIVGFFLLFNNQKILFSLFIFIGVWIIAKPGNEYYTHHERHDSQFYFIIRRN